MTKPVQTAKSIVDLLFDDSVGEAEKLAAFDHYLEDWGAGLRGSRRVRAALAWEALLQALPAEPQAQQHLERVISELSIYRHAERLGKRMEVRATLQQLGAGTRIVVWDGRQERIATFVECKRSRFVARFADGTLRSVPAEAFVRVADDAARLESPTRAAEGAADSEVA